MFLAASSTSSACLSAMMSLTIVKHEAEPFNTCLPSTGMSSPITPPDASVNSESVCRSPGSDIGCYHESSALGEVVYQLGSDTCRTASGSSSALSPPKIAPSVVFILLKPHQPP